MSPRPVLARTLELREVRYGSLGMPGFDAVVSAFRREEEVTIEPGWGSGNLTLKVGGKIFAMSVHGEVVAKLPKARVDELVTAGWGRRFDPRKNGKVMTEWLVLTAKGPSPLDIAREAYGFVKSSPRSKKR